MAHASQEMRRVQRELDRHLAMRAYMRSARHEAFRRAGTGGYVPVVARADHPCMSLCIDCGYLGAFESKTCPACGEGGFVDLALDEQAAQVRDIEAGRRAALPRHAFLLVGAVIVAAAVAVGVLLHSSVFHALAPHFLFGWRHHVEFGMPFIGNAAVDELVVVSFLLPALLALLLAMPAFLLLPRLATRLLSRPSPSKPERWHGPVPPGARLGRPELEDAGPVAARGGVMTAPFSGRPCVAFEVRVRQHDPRSARAPSWVLRETRNVTFEVGRLPIEEGKAVLRLPVERTEMNADEEAEARLARFLRERGLVSNDGELELFEACVVEGEDVEVSLRSGPLVAVVGRPRRSSRADRRRAGPYR